jgi:flagellar L-ring protein precursor FlgH
MGQAGETEIDAARERELLLLLEQFLEDNRSVSPTTSSPNPSLFPAGSSRASMFADHKARNVDDIVTIQIVETSAATNAANTSTERGGSTSAGAPSLFGIETNGSPMNFASLLNAMTDLSFDGEGSTSRTGSLVASISARVVEVRPNGAIVLEGTKEVTVNKETHILTLRGVARTQDVGPTNVISSNHIADMTVTFDGDGVVSRANKPGLFYRFIEFISPF